jgi:hypothetical protein
MQAKGLVAFVLLAGGGPYGGKKEGCGEVKKRKRKWKRVG